jgi:hypothetical protein
MKKSTHEKKTSKASAEERLKEAKRNNFFKDNGLVLSIVLILLLVGVGVSFLSSSNTEEMENLIYGDDVIEMHYFHLSTCPHCHKQNAFHSTILGQYPNVRINTYEITQAGTRAKLEEIAAQYPDFDLSKFGTPTSFIGEEFNVGYGSDSTTGQKLLSMVEKEQARIDANWDSTTMTKTIELRLAAYDAEEQKY